MKHKLFYKCLIPLSLAFILVVGSIFTHKIVETNSSAIGNGVDLPIVMYHHLLKEQGRLNKYTISPTEFREDMQYLKDQGYTPIIIQDLIDYTRSGIALPPHPVMITFDDGYESFYEYAFPILKEFEFKAVYSIVGRYADQYSATEDHHIRYSHATWNEIAFLQESGLVEIQNHSYNLHENSGARHGAKRKSGEELSHYKAMLEEDLGKLQAECEEHLGTAPTAFTYPFGQISSDTLPILKEMGFQAALTCEEKVNHLTGDPEELFHLRRFNRPHNSPLAKMKGF